MASRTAFSRTEPLFQESRTSLEPMCMPVDPHSPWQRPTNENTNGILRDHFPKGTDLSVHTAHDLARVQAELNHRPRKILGWDSPADHLATLLGPPSVLRR